MNMFRFMLIPIPILRNQLHHILNMQMYKALQRHKMIKAHMLDICMRQSVIWSFTTIINDKIIYSNINQSSHYKWTQYIIKKLQKWNFSITHYIHVIWFACQL